MANTSEYSHRRIAISSSQFIDAQKNTFPDTLSKMVNCAKCCMATAPHSTRLSRNQNNGICRWLGVVALLLGSAQGATTQAHAISRSGQAAFVPLAGLRIGGSSPLENRRTSSSSIEEIGSKSIEIARSRRPLTSAVLSREIDLKTIGREKESERNSRTAVDSVGPIEVVAPWRPKLPHLSAEDRDVLRSGLRVQKQTRNGGTGSGLAVVDVKASVETVMEILQNYDAYAGMIDTVREGKILSRRGATTTAEFTLSRFKIHVRVLLTSFMTAKRPANMVEFELDPNCTAAGKSVLKEAKGFWFVEKSDLFEDHTRIWMVASVHVNNFVPGFIVDYAAARALPRASTWLKPTIERAQRTKDLLGQRLGRQ